MPSSTSETISFYATNSDTIKLHIKKKPTITYLVNPNTTNTSVDINGLNVNVFPASFTYNYNELITLSPVIDPIFAFGSWSSDSNFFPLKAYDKFGKFIRLPSRLMTATDALVQAPNIIAAATYEATIEGAKLGKSGDDLNKYIKGHVDGFIS